MSNLDNKCFNYNSRRSLLSMAVSVAISIAIVATAIPKSAFASGQCNIDYLAQYTWGNSDASDLLNVESKEAQSEGEKLTFKGNVIGKRGQEVFNGDTLIYQRDTGDISTPAGMIYGEPSFAIRSKTANYQTTSETGQFNSADYYITDKSVIGYAEKIELDRKAKKNN